MKKKEVLRGFFCFLSILIMAIIFWFSSQTGVQSSNSSNSVVETVLSVFKPGFYELSLGSRQALIEDFSGTIRGLAHFSIFLLLGISVYSFFLTYRYNNKKLFMLSLDFCFLYAITDEVHQIFVDGRTFELLDIFIDTAGSLVGILTVILVIKLCKERKTNKLAI